MGCRGGHEHDQLKYGLSLYISREKGHQTRKPRSQRSLLPALPVGWLGENPGNQVAKHGTTIFFPITILFSENLKKKCPKGARKYTDCAHAPWASHNTP